MSDALNTLLVLLNALLVLITSFYAWATFRILKANEGVLAAAKDQSEALTRPYVSPVLYLVPGTNIFALRIENSGRTAARNLTLTLDRDFFRFGKKKSGQNPESVEFDASSAHKILIVMKIPGKIGAVSTHPIGESHAALCPGAVLTGSPYLARGPRALGARHSALWAGGSGR